MCEIQIVKCKDEEGYVTFELRLAGYSNLVEVIVDGESEGYITEKAEVFTSLLQWKVVRYEEETVTEKRLKKL